MALTLSGDALGLGKILQVVRGTDTTNRTTTSQTYTDAGISVSITPASTVSAVMLVWLCNVQCNGGSLNRAVLTITDSANTAISGAEDMRVGDLSSVQNYNSVSLIGYATPATVSSVTYKVRFRAEDSGTSVTIKNGSITGQLFAIEVAA